MSITTDQITIAITVFNRRKYLSQAISSALNQTVPVHVLVVEDCGPDPEMQRSVLREFGDRIEYIRNPKRRGLFDNWNACIEYCRTPWLSILHDDDFLSPKFAEAMIALNRLSPDCGLYFGQTQMVSEAGEPTQEGMRVPIQVPWRKIALADTVENTPFPYAGQLFRVDFAKAIGGFRRGSQFCADWEMWCELLARHGAAQSQEFVANTRTHGGVERGTNKIIVNGRLRALVFIQQKRVLRMLRERGAAARFDRTEFLRRMPQSVNFLLWNAVNFSPRMLRYNLGLLLRSKSPSLQHKLFQTGAKIFGAGFVKPASRMFRAAKRA